jgi:hypothetical protein
VILSVCLSLGATLAVLLLVVSYTQHPTEGYVEVVNCLVWNRWTSNLKVQVRTKDMNLFRFSPYHQIHLRLYIYDIYTEDVDSQMRSCVGVLYRR